MYVCEDRSDVDDDLVVLRLLLTSHAVPVVRSKTPAGADLSGTWYVRPVRCGGVRGIERTHPLNM